MTQRFPDVKQTLLQRCHNVIVLAGKSPPPPISINESQIERADKLSILGLIITRDLKWNDHVEKQSIRHPSESTY